MTLNAVADEISDRVKAALTGVHAKPTEGGGIISPQFLILTPDFQYRTTARKTDYELEGWLLLANQLSEQVARQLRTYAEPDSVKAAVEGNDRTLGGLVDDCRVMSFRWIRPDEFEMVQMVGGIFTIQIMGLT